MRDINFRGKRTDTGRWVYGRYLSEDTIMSGRLGCLNERHTTPTDRFDVIPYSVGEYTGLKDKNGKEIYEGDIVRNMNPESEAFKETSSVNWHSGIGGFTVIFESIGQNKMLGTYKEIEVIGNIYENQELLSL